MRWMPHIEGEFACRHIAPNLVELILVLVKRKKFYKTVITYLGKNKHNNILLHYFSCKSCFDAMIPAQEEDLELGEAGRYKITGRSSNHNQSKSLYEITVSGSNRYLAVRREIPDDFGFGYKFDHAKASLIWERAQDIAKSLIPHKSKDMDDPIHVGNTSNQTNTKTKTWTTKVAKTKIHEVISIMDDEELPHSPFDPSVYFFYKGKKTCDRCHVFFAGRGRMCRFCRKLTQSEIDRFRQAFKQALKGLNRSYRRVQGSDEDKKDALSRRFEDEGKPAVVDEMIEEKGYNETFSDLKESYGHSEACKMMGIDEAESEDQEGLSEYERNEK